MGAAQGHAAYKISAKILRLAGLVPSPGELSNRL